MNNDLLKRMRAYRGYKQYEIAEIIGLSRQTYNYKENGKLPFTSEEIIKISIQLNLRLEEVNDIFFNGQLPN